jgi:predicted GNAT superfamily acetyltransferase
MTEIKVLHTMPELETVVDLQVSVWGLNPRNAVPSALLHVLALRGGLVLGAYDSQRMVGILLALPAQDTHTRDWILWSHMTGIIPSYQGRGVGTALKRFQRKWALEQGYRRIGWTVDPLQRGNAHFNFHILGDDAAMISNTYHVNFYGDMDDDINRGIPSDRIEAMWHLDQPSLRSLTDSEGITLLSIDDKLQPCRANPDQSWNKSTYYVALPPDLNAIRSISQEAVLAWRLALRETLQAALAHGYSIVDFLPTANHNKYVLKRV